MADMILKNKTEQVGIDLIRAEVEKLKELGRTREYYEKLVDNIAINLG